MRRGLLFAFFRAAHHRKTSFQRFSSGSVAQIETLEKCNLEEMQGRPWKLFLAPTNTAIAHCVSSDFQMDKGIAKQFLKKYGNFDELMEKGLTFPEGHMVGKIGVLETKERFVYYLITRNRWWDRASYSAMEHSLRALRAHCDGHRVNRLAIPRLGAQHDRLEWSEVRELILDVFKDFSITITAYTQR